MMASYLPVLLVVVLVVARPTVEDDDEDEDERKRGTGSGTGGAGTTRFSPFLSFLQKAVTSRHQCSTPESLGLQGIGSWA